LISFVRSSDVGDGVGGGEDLRGGMRTDEIDFLRVVGRVEIELGAEVVGDVGDEADVDVREGVGGTLRLGVFDIDDRRLLNNMFWVDLKLSSNQVFVLS
jgi:hypothetical protein